MAAPIAAIADLLRCSAKWSEKLGKTLAKAAAGPQHREKWTKEEETELVSFLKSNNNNFDLAAAHIKKSVASIKSHLRTMEQREVKNKNKRASEGSEPSAKTVKTDSHKKAPVAPTPVKKAASSDDDSSSSDEEETPAPPPPKAEAKKPAAKKAAAPKQAAPAPAAPAKNATKTKAKAAPVVQAPPPPASSSDSDSDSSGSDSDSDSD